MLSSMRNWILRNSLVAFFVLAYAICSVMFFSYVAFPTLPYTPFWLVGIFSPTISALTIAGVTGGLPEIKRLLSGFTRWQIGWQWYLAISILLLGPLFVAVVYIGLGNPPSGLAPGMNLWSFIGALAYTLTAGPLAEETGWRGFALPRLQEKFSSLNASLLLGTLWLFWHVPQYFVPNTTMIPFPIFIPICICLAILFTWLYNNTGGSLVATVLAHFLFNFDGAFLSGHLGLAPAMVINVAGGIGIVVMVVLVVIFAGAKYLSRKPLEQLPFRRIGVSYGQL
jgi:membrane protease YdiL (CAAX protease family)